MTKQNEIEILRACVASLGANSYCGSWLSEQLAQIEVDIRNDFFPQHSRRECLKEIEQMRSEAQTKIEEMKKEMEKQKKQFEEKIQARKDEIWRAMHGLELELRNV